MKSAAFAKRMTHVKDPSGKFLRPGFWITVLLVTWTFLAGCHGDPNARKQRYYESGLRYSAQDKFNEAVIQFANALKNDERYPDAHYALGQVYLRMGKPGAAYAEFMRTVDLQPSHLKARIDIANLVLSDGQVEKAAEQAAAVMAINPNNPDLHALLSLIAVKKGLKNDALKEISRAIELDPTRALFHEDLAILSASDPALDAVVESELKTAAALEPSSMNPRLLLASFYAGKAQWKQAEDVDRTAIAANPQSLAPRESLAQIFAQQGDQGKTEEVLLQTARDLADNPRAVNALADYYERSGRSASFKAEFAALAATHPKNLAVQQAYGRALIAAGDYPTALNLITSLRKQHPKDSQLLALYGIALLNSGKPDDSASVLQDAAREYPKDAFIQFWKGRAEMAKGDLQSAKASFQLAMTLDPSRLDARTELAQLAADSGDIAMLSDIADGSVRIAPRFADGYLWRAMVEMSHHSFDKAEADLNTATSIAPRNTPAYVLLARIRFAQQRFPEGAALLDRALNVDPNSIEAMRLLVSCDLHQGHPEIAVARLETHIAANPHNSGLLALLAALQSHGKNLDLAATTAQRAIQANPEDFEAVIVFTQIQIRRNQTANALATWRQWSSAHPHDASAYAILGSLEEASGDTSRAEDDYRKALQIKPQQPIAANNLAYLMLQNGENADVALSLAQTARRGMPASPNTADTLAWAYYRKAAYTFARDLLEEAVHTDADNAAMQYHLGMVYTKLGEKSSATVHLKKAVSLSPDPALAKDANQAIRDLAGAQGD